MSKNILFLVTGMTPQIITETVYALAIDPENAEAWVPDEIHVVSTGKGAIQIRSRLLKDGWFAKLCQDYHLPNIRFDETTIHVICDQNGQQLDDLKTLADNEHSGNQICHMIKQFTQDPEISLHVSIAGGRKTMGFYAGYALSLYGRAQDRLSHVLVSEQFEFAQNFYYPTPYEHYVQRAHSDERLDTRQAQVFLADIPFVRMKDAIEPRHQLRQDASFSEVVQQINESYKDIHLQLNVHNRSIQINQNIVIENMPAREFAMLHWFADLRAQGKSGVYAPRENITNKQLSAEGNQYIRELTQQFMPYYQDHRDSEDLDISVDKKFFESVRSRLKSLLQNKIGLELAAKIAIVQADAKRGVPFYLDVDPAAIKITNHFAEQKAISSLA